MDELSQNEREELIRARVAELERLLAGLEIDAEVARITKDREMKEAVQAQVKKLVARKAAYSGLLAAGGGNDVAGASEEARGGYSLSFGD